MLGAAPHSKVEVHLVARLDVPGAGYYLAIASGEEPGGLVTIDAGSGEVLSAADLPAGGSHPIMGAEQARELAGAGEGHEARLVWEPGEISRSPLYPFWEVRTSKGNTYVDQAGRVWPASAGAGRGG